jgi:hypothetical protein
MAMKNEKELIEEINKHLDQGINDLDPGTLSEIRKARLKALEQKKRGWMLKQIPVGWVAAAILVMIVAANLLNTNDNKQPPLLTKKAESTQVTPESKVIITPTVIVENKPDENADKGVETMADQIALIEMLSDEKELELYENMEFYSWIAEGANSSG